MSELLNQHKAHKERLQRIAMAALYQAIRDIVDHPSLAAPVPVLASDQINAEWVEEQLRESGDLEINIPEIETFSPTINNIQRAVCKHYRVSRSDLISSRRRPHEVLPRMVAVYLCRVLTPMSLPAIGKHFGNRDHTTILHSERTMTARIKTEPELAATIEVLKGKFLDPNRTDISCEAADTEGEAALGAPNYSPEATGNGDGQAASA